MKSASQNLEFELAGIYRDQLSAVDFSALVLGFSSAALYYIGHSSIEGKAPQEKNLPLAKQNIEMIAPNRANRSVTQDGRPLRRYKHRWTVERTQACSGGRTLKV